ncbi:MAG: hypothetical protein M1812_002277 [Candelaria pacifica]|nr:MAG: hypothetical protein M1812_002277 [Candelaria pacifica]
MENLVYSGVVTPPPNPYNVNLYLGYPPSPLDLDLDEYGMPRATGEHAGRDHSGEESDLDRSGSRFVSVIFTIHVGPECTVMTAHESVLSQSPVLRCMCTGSFIENHTKILNLSDDDPEIFALLLEYLYSGTYDPKRSGDSPNNDKSSTDEKNTEPIKGKKPERNDDKNTEYNDDKKPSRIDEATDLYLMADKYALPRLQRVIIYKLSQNKIPHNSKSFFLQAQRIITHLPTTSGIFFDYFKIYAPMRLNPLVISEKWFADFFGEGGVFAVELMKVMGIMIVGPYPMDRDGNPTARGVLDTGVTWGGPKQSEACFNAWVNCQRYGVGIGGSSRGQ